MDVKCIGCGATLQTTNPQKKGYIAEEVYQKRSDDCYCKRCFDLRNYNKETKVDLSIEELKANITKINFRKDIVVIVGDLFDFNGTLLKDISFNQKNTILVLNKLDLFLNSINKNKLLMNVREILKENNLKFPNLMLISALNNNDIVSLIDEINNLRNNNDVYIIGMTNVGKSTIINKIIQYYSEEKDFITVSNTVNTTLENIYIPLNEKNYIIDTPGLINEKSYISYLTKQTLEKVLPKKFIRPKTFQLNPQQTIFVHGFIQIDFIKGKRSSFVTNFNNNVLIHRTKLENAFEFYEKHKDDILLYPTFEERKNLGKLTTKKIKFTEDKKIDIAISGIGFVSVYGEGEVIVHYFDKIDVIVRRSLI